MSYHDNIMRIQSDKDYTINEKLAHRDARHKAAEIAIGADNEIESLRAALAEAEKDAERLEWMVFHSASVLHSRDGDFCRVVWFDDRGEEYMTKSYGTTKEAIDAAIANESKPRSE